MKAMIRATTASVIGGLLAVAMLAGCDGGDPAATTNQVSDGRAADVARLQSQADQYERSAHLRGQALTHGAGPDGHETSDEEFVPGSRRMPTR